MVSGGTDCQNPLCSEHGVPANDCCNQKFLQGRYTKDGCEEIWVKAFLSHQSFCLQVYFRTSEMD